MTSLFLTSIAIVVAVPGIYLLVLSLAALVRRPSEPVAQQGDPSRFAIIIPAHNEALSIGDTIGCVQQSDYDPERYRVFVIADNCTDLTASIARGHGVEVAERHLVEAFLEISAIGEPDESHLLEFRQGSCRPSLELSSS